MEMKLKSPYIVHIKHTPNGGVLVEVACAQFAYSSVKKMLADLRKYLEDPETYEKKYQEMLQKPYQTNLMRDGQIAHVNTGITMSDTVTHPIGATIGNAEVTAGQGSAESEPTDQGEYSIFWEDTSAAYEQDAAKEPAQEETKSDTRERKKS